MIDLRYEFRNPERAREFQYLHPHLRRLFMLVCHILNDMEFDVLITSMIRPADTISAESGVHATGRAIDCVPMARSKMQFDKLDLQMKLLCECLNKMYPRKDSKPLIMWHEVKGGGGLHLHVQVPWTADFKDLTGKIPDTDA